MAAVIGNAKVASLGIGKTIAIIGTSDPDDHMIPIAWSDIPDPSTLDWVALFRPGASNSDYLGAPRFTGSTASSGSAPFVIPTDTPQGAYELRLFSDKTAHRLAQSPGFYVQQNGVTGVAGIELLYAGIPSGGVAFGPSSPVYFRTRTPNPSASPGDTVACVCVENGSDVAYMSVLGGLTENYLTMPSNLAGGYHYCLQYRRSNTNEIWAQTEPWSWNAANVAGTIQRVWDVIRNSNNSVQTINYDLTTWKSGHLLVIRPANNYNVTTDSYYIPTGTTKGAANFTVTSGWTPGVYQALLYDGYTGQLAIYGQPFTVTS